MVPIYPATFFALNPRVQARCLQDRGREGGLGSAACGQELGERLRLLLEDDRRELSLPHPKLLHVWEQGESAPSINPVLRTGSGILYLEIQQAARQIRHRLRLAFECGCMN